VLRILVVRIGNRRDVYRKWSPGRDSTGTAVAEADRQTVSAGDGGTADSV